MKKLLKGKKVLLEYDVQKRDRHGRTLAYVYLEDSTFLNAHLLEKGLARMATYPPNVRYEEVF
ncbi:endonuclease YncB(thermonuclease family) [Algoriphagus iocasae]|uniref:Endonuclease YncB(Thermonuclease family) n=1 Tax=Algoriphagus iocasae TaxID=1836499 RepID=A0A841N1N7_9BACT|nr:endonuclease YncB(thermonuclease family) [Algoriphagus iocasae]